MQKLVDWLLARRLAVVALAALFAPNITILSSAIMGLQWASRGPVVGTGDALLACLAVSVMALIAAGGPSPAAPIAIRGCAAIVSGCIVGGILRATGTLTLAVQIVLLLAFAGIALFTLFGPSSNALFDAQIAQLAEVLRAQGWTPEDVAAIEALKPRLVGFLGLEICLQILLPMLLAAWLLGYARREPLFGEQFRALRIGYVIGVPAVLVLVSATVSGMTLPHNLFGVAALAFMLQGLSLVHRKGHAAGWHAIQYVPVYVIGVLFGSYLLLMGIFGQGLLS